jgi:hypothetical protein
MNTAPSTVKRSKYTLKLKPRLKTAERAHFRLAQQKRAPAPAFAGLTSKQRGELAEMMFMVKASTKRLVVAKPYGESQRYDFIVDSGKRTWRVQVKSSSSTHCRAYTVNTYWKTTRKHLPYSPSKVDFIAVMILGTDIWYLIPVRAVVGRLMVRVYPFGGDPRGSRRYEKYREAWHLLGPNKLARRRRP